MQNNDETLRIKSIKVTGLFGLYDHLVALKDDRVTVIHGPNGVGKTVFLKLTNSFLSGRYNEIIRVPFKKFEILFDDNSVASIVFEKDNQGAKQVNLKFENPTGVSDQVILDREFLSSEKMAAEISESNPYYSRVGSEEWVDRRTDEVISAEELVARNSEYVPKDKKKWLVREPKGLKNARSRISVHLIEAQRLIRITAPSSEWRYRAPDRGMTATVQEYSKDLKRRLETSLANYAKQSQKLDQTFPQRLLEGTVGPFSLEQLKHEMQSVEATRVRLRNIGILDNGDPSQDSYPLQISQLDSLQPGQLSVMSVYARDTREKLAVLEDLSERTELLIGVLNRKFTNKKVTISRESGLAIYGIDEKLIPITALSSGEQHELVLLYDLLFKVKANTLVLIDEPELSLHISWQKGFLSDLLRIIDLAHFDVLMATHSPYIVGDRSDLLVVLSPERDDESQNYAE